MVRVLPGEPLGHFCEAVLSVYISVNITSLHPLNLNLIPAW